MTMDPSLLSAAACPLCEATSFAGLYPPSHPKFTSSRSRQEEIAYLLYRAERLDLAMQRIIDKRHATLRELNNIQPSTCLLPFELLSYIFQLASPPIDFSERSLCESDESDDYLDSMSDNGTDMFPQPKCQVDLRFRYFPLVLGAVCSAWRKVAWMTPELWTTFAVEVLQWKLKSQIPLIRLYLINSGSHPVSLDLDIRVQHCAFAESDDDNAPLTELNALQNLGNLVFNEFSTKIKTLRLAGAPPAWMVYLTETKLPNLQDLTFGWGFDGGELISVQLEGGIFTVAPGVPLLEESSLPFPLLPPSLPQQLPPSRLPPLTTLHLRNVHLTLCAKILYYTPHLVEYHEYYPVYAPLDAPNPKFSPFQEPYSLPTLKRFGWSTQDGEQTSIDLFNNIRLPSLEEVQLSGFSEEILTEDSEAALCFFSNLPTSVHSLSYYAQDAEFFDSSDDYLHYRSAFSAVPQIRTLAFIKCSGCFLRSIFSLLSSRFPENNPQCLLPSLERIVIRNLDDDGDDMSVAFVEMVKTRRSVLQSQSFIFEAVDCELTWSRSAQDGLRELAYDFALTVKENSEVKVYGYFTDRELDIFNSGIDETSSPSPLPVPGPGHSESPISPAISPIVTAVIANLQPLASTSSSTAEIGEGEGGTFGIVPFAGDSTLGSTFFSAEFMQGVASALDDIDPSLFRPGDDLDFERDFEQWFNAPDDTLSI